MLSKPNPFFGQLVYDRCLGTRMTVATEVSVTHIISKNKNNIGLVRCLGKKCDEHK